MKGVTGFVFSPHLFLTSRRESSPILIPFSTHCRVTVPQGEEHLTLMRKCGMMINTECLHKLIYNHITGKPMGISMREFLMSVI